MDEKVRELINSGASEEKFREEMTKSGFESMGKEGLELVDSGVTSLSEYLRTMYDAR
jgi:type II secretory ATPase GspE/PulE/Tfp pilus assembly ATPase PilB-like protein